MAAELNSIERQLVEEYGKARRQNGAGTLSAEAIALADRLRLQLPDLDDTTIAKVVMAIGTEMLTPDEQDGRFASVTVILVYAASVLGEAGLIDPREA